MENEKLTRFRRKKLQREAEIYELWTSLLKEGYMKMQAYKAIMDRYEIASISSVWACIKRHERRLADGNSEN